MTETNSNEDQELRDSYDRHRSRKRRKQFVRNLQLFGLILVAGFGLAYVAYQVLRPPQVNTAKAITSQDFNPLNEYDVILEKGSPEQKLILLRALVEQPQSPDADLPILTDLNKKILVAAGEVIGETELSDADHHYAAIRKLNAVWQLYFLNIQNDVHDPFVCDEYRKSIEEFIDDEDVQLSKAAHIGKLRFLTGEFITKRNADVAHISNAAIAALKKFPNDGEIIVGVRRSHAQLISFKNETASSFAESVSSMKEINDSKEFSDLLRHFSDLNLLYEAGIGNLPSISDLNTTVEDFYDRVNQLAGNPNIGETVYKQLANSISYLEKQGQNELAKSLGRTIVETSAAQADKTLAEAARSLGVNCVKRNSLLDKPWQFEEIDFRGRSISNDKFHATVSLIVFYPQNPRRTPKFLKMLNSLEKAFQGRNLRIIYVAVVEDSEKDEIDFSVGDKNILLVTSKDKPNKFLQQCPTERLPYFILVNPQGLVDSINVPTNALKTRIESLF